MAKVNFTQALKRFYPDLKSIEIDCDRALDLVNALNDYHPGIKGYLVDETGELRKHVNIFIGEQLIKDRKTLTDKINPTDTVYIMQALSGG